MPSISFQQQRKQRTCLKRIKLAVCAFVSRLFYAYRLVWEAKPSLLVLMVGMSIFSGVTPVLGSLIGAKLLNQLTLAYTGELLTF